MAASSGEDLRWEPRWPTDDPFALQWWIEEVGAEDLGSNLNAWLGVISYASSRILGDLGSAERKGFRDAALAAIDSGRRVGVLPAQLCAEKEIYVRMSYLRTSADGLEWQRREMSCIIDIFFGALRMGLDDARNKSRSWRNEPVAVVKSLREIKNLLNLIEPGARYLDAGKFEVLDGWLKVKPLLP